MDPLTLDELSMFQLKRYNRETPKITPKGQQQYDALERSPVRVSITSDQEICDSDIYNACLQVQGHHLSFSQLREKLSTILSEAKEIPDPEILTVLFEGIFIGNPQNLEIYMTTDNPLPPTPRGLGKKLAEIDFPTIRIK